MTIDRTTLELLEMKVANRVEASIRTRIFGVYGTVAAGILAAFGYFGYDVFSSLEETATKAASSTATEAALNEIDPVLTAANKAAKAARDKADEARDLATRNEIELAALEKFRHQAQVRLNTTLNDVEATSLSIQSSLDDLRTKIKGAEEDVDGFRERSKDLFLPVGYEKDILSLSADVVKLSKILKELREGSEISELQVIDVSGAESTLETIRSRVDEAADVESTTVYVQFAGVAREQINKLTSQLKLDGYTVPGEERIGSAAGKAEVRYFYLDGDDEKKAKELARRTNDALKSLGLKDNVAPQYINLSKGNPRRGVLELWIEPRLN